jgi:hypothetical protein
MALQPEFLLTVSSTSSEMLAKELDDDDAGGVANGFTGMALLVSAGTLLESCSGIVWLDSE